MDIREEFEKFYKTITPAVPHAGYEDITMDASYLSWKQATKLQADRIAEQLHTIKSLNTCIGGAESLTLDNIKSAGDWLKEDENLLGRVSRERDEVVAMLGMLATERAKVEALTKQLAEQPNVDVLVEALKHADEFIRNGVDFGYIRMPDEDLKGIDSAHDTPKIIANALATYQSKN